MRSDEEAKEAQDPAIEERPLRPEGAVSIGQPRPSSPKPVFAEDFSLLIRAPRRLRWVRDRAIVLLH